MKQRQKYEPNNDRRFPQRGSRLTRTSITSFIVLLKCWNRRWQGQRLLLYSWETTNVHCDIYIESRNEIMVWWQLCEVVGRYPASSKHSKPDQPSLRHDSWISRTYAGTRQYWTGLTNSIHCWFR